MSSGNDIYSGYQLQKLFGMRSGAALFTAMELGWVCPVDKTHNIGWSEFNQHLYCEECDKDYFTFLCKKAKNQHTTTAIYQQELKKFSKQLQYWTVEKYKEIQETHQ